MNTKTQSHRSRALWSLLGLVTLCTLPGIAAASDVDELLAQGKFCSATAQAAFRACGNDGSFKAGRDGDKPGIIFQANPTVGQFYVEEFSLGNAEDATEVLSVNYAFGKDPELDELVPRKLAKLLCNGDCIVTRNFSQIEPGVFLEVEPESGEVVRLVKCNVDPRCASLPQP